MVAIGQKLFGNMACSKNIEESIKKAHIKVVYANAKFYVEYPMLAETIHYLIVATVVAGSLAIIITFAIQEGMVYFNFPWQNTLFDIFPYILLIIVVIGSAYLSTIDNLARTIDLK